MNDARLEQYDTYPVPMVDIFYDASFNCRGQFTLESVRDLADSIQQRGNGVELKGLDFPIVVQPVDDIVGEKPAGFGYRLIAGHRRFKAVETFLKWLSIPATIRKGLTDRDARMLNFIENLERKDLNILEEAVALGRLYPSGVAVRVASKEIKRPTKWVHDRLRLLTLPEEVQQLAATGLLAASHVPLLAELETPAAQIRVAQRIVDTKRLHGAKASLNHLHYKYRRKIGCRKSKEQINALVAQMLNCGIMGLAPRVAAWCAGYLSDAEIEQDIADATPETDSVLDVANGEV